MEKHFEYFLRVLENLLKDSKHSSLDILEQCWQNFLELLGRTGKLVVEYKLDIQSEESLLGRVGYLMEKVML